MRVPQDHVNHPEFKTEWWYWNGHLVAEDGAAYDFFLSFTRHDIRGDRFLGIPLWSPQPESWIGMFALTDRQRAVYDARAKINAPDLFAAGAEDERPFVWHDSWSAQWADGAFYVTARVLERTVHLKLTPKKPAALYGRDGFVETIPGNPHYVYSYTDMDVDGAFVDGQRHVRLRGQGWFDHFIGKTANTAFRAWDWMSIQLDDGYQYMIAQLRMDDGQCRPYANFVVKPDGSVATLPDGQPSWHLERSWKSGSGETYRLVWTIRTDDLDLHVEPVLEDQEFRHPPVQKFWEGATRISGTHLGAPAKGQGYLETVAEGGLPIGGMSLSR